MCKTFITKNISNKDIYEKLMSIEEQTKITNGTVKWHTKAIAGLFTLVCGMFALIGL